MCANIIYISVFVWWISRQPIIYLFHKTIPMYTEKIFNFPNGLTKYSSYTSDILLFLKSELNLSGDQEFPSRNKMDNLCFDQPNPMTNLKKSKAIFFHPYHMCLSACLGRGYAIYRELLCYWWKATICNTYVRFSI